MRQGSATAFLTATLQTKDDRKVLDRPKVFDNRTFAIGESRVKTPLWQENKPIIWPTNCCG
jgi:hypothetical protein